MRLPNPICLLETIWYWLRGMLTAGIPIAGHAFVHDERVDHCVVLVLKCERCDKYAVSWEKTVISKPLPYSDEVKEVSR